MRILACVLEFPTWELAKPWSFISGYAFVDALREAGHDVQVAPLTYQMEARALTNTLHAYKRSGASFDCAFFWLPHLEYSRKFWHVARSLSAKRVAVLIESLSYTREEISELHHLTRRRRWVVSQLAHCTHTITFDYQDFQDLSLQGFAAFWTPGIVVVPPAGTMLPYAEKSKGFIAAGTIYGKRRALHAELVARGLLDPNESFAHSPALIADFEQLMTALRTKCADDNAAADELGSLGEQVLTVRRQLWYEYLRYISQFTGVISLPAFFKGLPGRVFEAILARCAVFMVESGNLARQKSVFEDQKHIFYFNQEVTAANIGAIARINADRELRANVTADALARALEQCGADIMVARMLDWIRTERSPWPSLLRRIAQKAGISTVEQPKVYGELNYEAS